MNIRFPNNVLYPSSSKQLPKIRHRVGNVYHIDSKDTSVYCVLAQVGIGKIVLICLENDTNRWIEPIVVKNVHEISQEEFEEIRDDLTEEEIVYVGRLENVIVITADDSCDLSKSFGEENS